MFVIDVYIFWYMIWYIIVIDLFVFSCFPASCIKNSPMPFHRKGRDHGSIIFLKQRGCVEHRSLQWGELWDQRWNWVMPIQQKFLVHSFGKLRVNWDIFYKKTGDTMSIHCWLRLTVRSPANCSPNFEDWVLEQLPRSTPTRHSQWWRLATTRMQPAIKSLRWLGKNMLHCWKEAMNYKAINYFNNVLTGSVNIRQWPSLSEASPFQGTWSRRVTSRSIPLLPSLDGKSDSPAHGENCVLHLRTFRVQRGKVGAPL